MIGSLMFISLMKSSLLVVIKIENKKETRSGGAACANKCVERCVP